MHGEPNCKGHDPAIFYVERGQSTHTARSLCTTCPLIVPCRNLAIDTNERLGIWGNTTPRQRYPLIARAAAQREPTHSTRIEYLHGCRCAPCTAASSAYNAASRQRAKTRQALRVP